MIFQALPELSVEAPSRLKRIVAAWYGHPIVRFAQSRLHRGDEIHWAQWEQVRRNAQDLPGDRLGVVESIVYADHRGTKGYITWFETGVTEAFWSNFYTPERGSGLHVHGAYADRARDHPPLFFINAVKADLDQAVRLRWRRHELRRRARHAAPP